MTTKAQTAERLLQVVRVLEELPPKKRLDMRQWYKCGTVACALGWSGVDPWFTRRSFKTMTRLGNEKMYKRPYYKGSWELLAAQDFFGINYWDAYHLFMPKASFNSRRSVVERIKAFVKALPA